MSVYFFGYKHDIDDDPPARTKVEHSFTHVHTRWSTNGPFHTGQICCRAPFLGFSASISGAGGFPTIVVFGGGFEARVILSLPEVWDTTSVALRKQPKSRHFSEATRHSFMLMIYNLLLSTSKTSSNYHYQHQKTGKCHKNIQKNTKTLVVVPFQIFQPPSPSCANICRVSFHLLDVETRQAPNGSMQGGLHITPEENTAVICCDAVMLW